MAEQNAGRRNSAKIFYVTLLSVFAVVAVLLVSSGSIRKHLGLGPAQTLYDTVGLLSDQQIQILGEYHAKLLEEHDIDYRVLVYAGSSDIDTYANEQFTTLTVGEHSQSGRGLLLVINPAQDRVRMEVSAGLEGVFTDAFIAYIQQRQMVPFFRSRRVAAGIMATTELMFTRAQEAVAGSEFSPPMESFSTGGGAGTGAMLGAGRDESFAGQSDHTNIPGIIGNSPEQIVALYHAAMRERNARPDLAIYSQATKQMMANWTVTPAQMDNLAKTYAKCRIDRVFVLNAYAVVRYPIEQRQCAPYFLVQEDAQWKLELTHMMTTIRFNHRNEWRFDKGYPLVYKFGFADWNFDRNGFPHSVAKLRWYLGVHTRDDKWTYVDWVGEGSPAEQLGLQVGDVILQWDELERPSNIDVSRKMAEVPEGRTVRVVVARGEQKHILEGKAPDKVR